MAVGNQQWTDITDSDLDELVQEIKVDFPNSGESLLAGIISSRGYRISRQRLRDCIHRTDMLNTALRWGNLIQRRPYSVPGPNSLWHLDGNHRLIRWRMVIHGGIDGFSRAIVYIKCSTNNFASTVLRLFREAIHEFGLPSRIRVDLGGENVQAAELMLLSRGTGRGSVITGSFVHNQRIERLWRDVFTAVISLFYRVFYYLEDQRLLDPLSEADLFALHYVYVPRINSQLQAFKAGWNNHSLRTEHSHTPMQIFVQNMLLQSATCHSELNSGVQDDYGVDQFGPIPRDDSDTTGVTVPRSQITLSNTEWTQLMAIVDPLAESDHYGMDLYEHVRNFVLSTLSG